MPVEIQRIGQVRANHAAATQLSTASVKSPEHRLDVDRGAQASEPGRADAVQRNTSSEAAVKKDERLTHQRAVEAANAVE